MSSLRTDLLFLHGHITDWRLAQRLSVTPAKPASDPSTDPAPEPRDRHSTLAYRGKLLLRLCLGIGSGELHKQ